MKTSNHAGRSLAETRLGRSALGLALILLAGCAAKDPAPRSAASPPPKGKSLEERLRAIEDYVADVTPIDPPEVTSPQLTKLAAQEFLRRLPTAQKPEPKIQFVSPGWAIVSISYTLSGSTVPPPQEIHFFYEKGTWTLFWLPESLGRRVDLSPAAAR